MDKDNTIIEKIVKYADQLTTTYPHFIKAHVPKAKFNVAQALYAQDIEYEDVLYMVDTTLFGNAKNGVIISNKGFYSRYLGDNYKFYFRDIQQVQISDRSHFSVRFNNGNKSTIYYNQLSNSIVPLLNELVEVISLMTDEIQLSESKIAISKPLTLKDVCTQEELIWFKNIISSMYDKSSTYIDQIEQIKLANATNSFATSIDKKDIFAFLDFTVFGSGKEGIIFTYNQLIFKYGHKKFVIPYNDYVSSTIETYDTQTGKKKAIINLKYDVRLDVLQSDYFQNYSQSIPKLVEFLDYVQFLYQKYHLSENLDSDNSFEGAIDRIIKKYQTSLVNSAIHLRGDIPEEKFNKTKSVYAKNAIFDQTYLYADSTFTGNGRNGSLITFWGIYSRDIGSDVNVYFSDIDKMEADSEHLYLVLKNGSKLIISNSVFHEDKLLNLLTDIIRLYKNVDTNPKNYGFNNSSYDYPNMIKSFHEDLSQKSFDMIQKLYQAGSPYAGIELASRYRKGIGVNQDINQAVQLLDGLQSAVAYRLLGEVCYNGEAGTSDKKLAEKYFKKSAHLGDLEAEVWIANFYFLGVNRNINYNEAFARYKSIVDSVQFEKLVPSIKSNIGLCYRFGYGCTQDMLQAEYWLSTVIDLNRYAKYLVAELYVDDDEFSSKSDIGIQYLNELCKEQDPLAMCKMGKMYFMGIKVDVNYLRAYVLFNASSKLGQTEATYYCGLLHTFNYLGKSNYRIAFDNILSAAENGFPSAMRDVGIMCQFGIGTKKDICKAKQWFDKASFNGDIYSKEWKEHTKIFLNKIKAINAAYRILDENNESDSQEPPYSAIQENLQWSLGKDSDVCGLHKLICDYPELIRRQIPEARYEKAKRKLKGFEKAINYSIKATSSFTTAENTRYFNNFFQRQGHGSGMEYGAHVNDLLHFKNAKWVGGANIIDGADRIVNSRYIQSKCYKDSAQLMRECFPDGNVRYIAPDGIPQIIEVNSDIYEKVYKKTADMYGEEFADKNIKNSGISSRQAENITKFGTIDSLVADTKMGVVNGRNAMVMSFAISFAMSVWNGDSIEEAGKTALANGVKAFGAAFATTVISSQIMKTSLLKGINMPAKLVGENTQKVLSKATETTVNTSKSASNILKSNIVGAVVTTAVLSSADIARLITGRISKEQLTKNIAVTGVGVFGGSAGYVAGAAIGSILIPIPGVGTFVGGIVGATITGGVAGQAIQTTMDSFIKNDGDIMLDIFNKEFQKLAEDYLLGSDEIEYVISRITEEKLLRDSGLRDIYASQDRKEYCRELLIPLIEEVCELRNFIVVPTLYDMAVQVI
jgi:TPR repeat protein